MVEVRRRPGHGRMTVIAVVAARQVSRVLAGCSDAIVAGSTATEHLRMVHGVYGLPGNRIVAVLTNVGRLHMGRVLAGSVSAVVAAGAIAGDIDVIEIGRSPARG